MCASSRPYMAILGEAIGQAPKKSWNISERIHTPPVSATSHANATIPWLYSGICWPLVTRAWCLPLNMKFYRSLYGTTWLIRHPMSRWHWFGLWRLYDSTSRVRAVPAQTSSWILLFGNFSGSPATRRVVLIQSKTGDARISGSLASLWIGESIHEKDESAIEISIQKFYWCRRTVFFWRCAHAFL